MDAKEYRDRLVKEFDRSIGICDREIERFQNRVRDNRYTIEDLNEHLEMLNNRTSALVYKDLVLDVYEEMVGENGDS